MAIFPETKGGKPTGRFVVKVRLEDGSQPKRIVKTLKEAKMLEATILVEGVAAATKPVGPTLGKLYEDAKEHLWEGTKDEAQSVQRLLAVIELMGIDTLVEDVCQATLDTLKGRMKAKGLAHPTRNRYLAALSKAMGWARSRGMTVQDLEFEYYKEPKKKFSWLTVEDQARLHAWLEDPANVRGQLGTQVSLLVKVLVFTGMRISELLGLDAGDVDLAHETVSLWGDRTKTSLDRSQPLPQALGAPLRALIVQGLPSYVGIQGVLYRARDALGLDPELTIHSLRHTTATRLAHSGQNALVVMNYMGHRSLKTTERYTHVDDKAKRIAGEALMASMGFTE